MREAPAVREVRPEATAASWSARSRGKPSDIARRSPSAETTTVWDTPGVLSAKLVINQLRFCAAWLIWLTNAPAGEWGWGSCRSRGRYRPVDPGRCPFGDWSADHAHRRA